MRSSEELGVPFIYRDTALTPEDFYGPQWGAPDCGNSLPISQASPRDGEPTVALPHWHDSAERACLCRKEKRVFESETVSVWGLSTGRHRHLRC